MYNINNSKRGFLINKKLGNSISYIRKLKNLIDEYILIFFIKIRFNIIIEEIKKKVLWEKEIEIDFPLKKVNEEDRYSKIG